MKIQIPYWPLLIVPALAFSLGFAMNAFVMSVNHGQMPVLWPGGCTADIMNMADAGTSMSVHGCMTYGTHLKFLADWIVIRGVGVASPGDFLEWFYEYTYMYCWVLWALLMIKDF